MKIKIGLLLKIYFWTTVGVSFLAVIFISIFLYKYLYQAVTQTSVIYNLKLELAVEPVNLELFRNIGAKLENKKAPSEIKWEELKNPFLASTPPPAEKQKTP